MDSQQFVDAIKRNVMDAAVDDTIGKLKSPPGRKVSTEEKARSDWYNGLSATERAHVDRIIAIAVHEGIFGLLAVIDGSRAIDSENGLLELFYVDSERVLLNNPEAIGLHDLLNASK